LHTSLITLHDLS